MGKTKFTIYPTKKLKQKMKKVAEKERRSINNLILKVMEEYVNL